MRIWLFSEVVWPQIFCSAFWPFLIFLQIWSNFDIILTEMVEKHWCRVQTTRLSAWRRLQMYLQNMNFAEWIVHFCSRFFSQWNRYSQVQELVAMGSALDYILDYPSHVTLTDFKLWGAQIASGMNYLEEKGWVVLASSFVIACWLKNNDIKTFAKYNRVYEAMAWRKKSRKDRRVFSTCFIWWLSATIKSSRFAATFRGISQLGSAFLTLRWFDLAQICSQVTRPHKGQKSESVEQNF